jgi:hypothetical protein
MEMILNRFARKKVINVIQYIAKMTTNSAKQCFQWKRKDLNVVDAKSGNLTSAAHPLSLITRRYIVNE